MDNGVKGHRPTGTQFLKVQSNSKSVLMDVSTYSFHFPMFVCVCVCVCVCMHAPTRTYPIMYETLLSKQILAFGAIQPPFTN